MEPPLSLTNIHRPEKWACGAARGRSSRAIGLCPRVICDDFVTARRLGLGSHLYRIVSGNQGEPIFVGENRQNHPGLGALFLRHGYYPALNSFLISTLRSGLVVRIPVGTAISRPAPSFLFQCSVWRGIPPAPLFHLSPRGERWETRMGGPLPDRLPPSVHGHAEKTA